MATAITGFCPFFFLTQGMFSPCVESGPAVFARDSRAEKSIPGRIRSASAFIFSLNSGISSGIISPRWRLSKVTSSKTGTYPMTEIPSSRSAASLSPGYSMGDKRLKITPPIRLSGRYVRKPRMAARTE